MSLFFFLPKRSLPSFLEAKITLYIKSLPVCLYNSGIFCVFIQSIFLFAYPMFLLFLYLDTRKEVKQRLFLFYFLHIPSHPTANNYKRGAIAPLRNKSPVDFAAEENTETLL